MSPPDGRIEVRGLGKVFGAVHAVDDLTFSVAPGQVTGFLGPNGAGKTTTLRCLLGLVTPTSGSATINGVRYAELPDPIRTVGAALEASGFHPARSARNHLLVLCAAAGLPARRADEALAQVALDPVGDRKTGTFSLGMRQRLALAAALLGEPRVLILDEPANGLDPEGIAWLRGFLRDFAERGGTVLTSSHVLSEVAQTVDNVVIISRGRLVRQAPLVELTAAGAVRVRTPQPQRLAEALIEVGDTVRVQESAADGLVVSGLDIAAVGHAAFLAGVELHELSAAPTDLEHVFLELTNGNGQ